MFMEGVCVSSVLLVAFGVVALVRTQHDDAFLSNDGTLMLSLVVRKETSYKKKRAAAPATQQQQRQRQQQQMHTNQLSSLQTNI